MNPESAQAWHCDTLAGDWSPIGTFTVYQDSTDVAIQNTARSIAGNWTGPVMVVCYPLGWIKTFK